MERQFQWLSEHWHACTRLKITVCSSSKRGSGPLCERACSMLEDICQSQQQMLPLRWLHVRSDFAGGASGNLPIESLMVLAPQLLVADLLQPWSIKLNPSWGINMWCPGNSITRRLCSESLHHLRARIPTGFEVATMAVGLPNVQTLHFECQAPLYHRHEKGGDCTLDISLSTACRQLYLGNILPRALIVPHGCQVYVEKHLHAISDAVRRLGGVYRCVVGLKLHLDLTGYRDHTAGHLESALRALPSVCAAFPGVKSLIMHINVAFDFALRDGSPYIDLQAIAAFQHLTALQVTCNDLSRKSVSEGWVNVPAIPSLTRMSIQVLGAHQGLNLDLPNLNSRLQQLAISTHFNDQLAVAKLSHGLVERGLRLACLRSEGSQGELSPACHYLTPVDCADPPAGSLQEVEHFFRSAVDIPWASFGQFVDQLPSS